MGSQDVDQDWMKRIRSTLKEFGKIVPRFSFQAWTRDDYQALHFSQDSLKEVQKLVDLITAECRKQQFDGVVVEHSLPFLLGTFAQTLKSTWKDASSLELIVVWLPLRENDQVSLLANAAKMKELAEWVDGFSLMTYDYSNPSIPGPNAPMEWVQEALTHVYSEEISSKIFLGLNFYGYDYSQFKMEAITGPKYLELVKQYEPQLIWDQVAKEAHFTYVDPNGKEHQVWYPTLKSIQERIKYAQSQNVGISIWEIGQGLRFFFDLI